jgi:FixJ family two-component response regulator
MTLASPLTPPCLEQRAEPQGAHIVVVDDDRDLALSISRLLSRNDYQVSTFLNAEEMLAKMPDAAPDCVLTDVMMGDLDGFQLAEQVHAIFPATALIFMTAWPNVSDAVSSFHKFKGVNYLQKPMSPAVLLEAIAQAVQWSRPRIAAIAATKGLSGRERDVLSRLAKGFSNKQIAFDLGLSPKTIEHHRATLLSKFPGLDLVSIFQIWRYVEDVRR